MAGLGDLLGKGSVVEQLVVWGVMNQALGAVLAPYLQQLQQDVEARTPNVPLAPPDLADAVVRNYLDPADAAAEAARSGLDGDRFATTVHLHGDAPGPQQLVEALLRGIIAAEGTGAESTSFEQGIREGRLADKWIPMFRQLGVAVLSAPDAAAAVIRNFMTEQDGQAEAAKSGVPPGLFTILTHLAGDAPGPQQLAEALRRGLITADGAGPGSTSFKQGIAEGRLADKWAPVIEGLAQLWPSPVDALQAELEGQLPHDQAFALYQKLGGDPEFYTWMFNTRGSAPTPLEAADMARRGIIPWEGTGPQATTFQQAFLEGPWRNKWESAFRKQAEFIPTAREAITLLKDGAATKDQAAAWMKQQGADDATIAAFIAEADATALSQYRGLTTSTVLNMYYSRLISPADAAAILEALHVSADAAPLMLAYADMQRAIAQQNAAVSRIGAHYTARKITADTARQSLIKLQVPAAAVDDILQTWQLENSINVKTLTESQIVRAWSLSIMDDLTALTELGNIGYTPYDAWVLLSIEAKAPLPGQPSPGPAPPQGAVIPGTT